MALAHPLAEEVVDDDVPTVSWEAGCGFSPPRTGLQQVLGARGIVGATGHTYRSAAMPCSLHLRLILADGVSAKSFIAATAQAERSHLAHHPTIIATWDVIGLASVKALVTATPFKPVLATFVTIR